MFKLAEYILDHKEISSTQVPTIKNFGGEEPVYKHIKNIPTSQAIDMLAAEWRDRPPVYPNVRKEVYWPMVKRAEESNTYFIAIVPSSQATEAVPSFRDPRELHITVSFLGNKTESEIESIKLKLYELTKGTTEFSLQSSGYSSFNGHAPHLSFKTNERALALYDKVMSSIGTASAFTEYKPHMTVGSDFVPSGAPVEVEVRSVVLYKIEQGRYVPVAQFPLQSEGIIDKIKSFFSGLF